MHWYNNGGGMSGGGYALMMVGMALLAGLLIVAIMVLVRSTGGNQTVASIRAVPSTPETILAERLARGEIDNDEYRRRMDSLRSHISP